MAPHQWDNNLSPYQALGYPAAGPMYPRSDMEHMNYLDESGAPQHLRGFRNLYPINANANAAENIQQSVSNTNLAAAPTGSASNFPGAGAVQNQGGPQPILRLRDPDPSNAIANAADNIQQPASGAAAPTNPAPMTIAQRLDNGLIEDVEGLTREEEDELVDWAREKGMTWDAIRRKFKFPLQESTLRVRFRTRRMDRPPRVPEFTERDDELLLEAVEVLAGRHLDNVDDYIRRLWNSAQEYIQSHGGTTTAGPVTLKKRYWFLIEQTPQIRGDLEPSKAKWDHKSYEKYHVPGQEEADFEESNEDEPTGETSAGRGGEGQELNELQWNHAEYEQYDVPGLEEADFEDNPEEERSGDTSAPDGRAGPELMEFEWDHAEYEQYEVEDEEGADFEEDEDEGDHAS
ncbi:hypothetical protein N8I77_007651 [Diaporthe amygdali]|uniref:Myb-like domain-containing protein n=1 Tax=Phomopsis amygdali TaxID=1214568 RepID=A0AAD9W4B2_PHOAM|nr:hypothetical protein N8I77_007651 [Diaporthe amygdali]